MRSLEKIQLLCDGVENPPRTLLFQQALEGAYDLGRYTHSLNLEALAAWRSEELYAREDSSETFRQMTSLHAEYAGRFLCLAEGRIGTLQAFYAAFYMGLLDQYSLPIAQTIVWRCVIQQALTRAFCRLSPAGAEELMGAYERVQSDKQTWNKMCYGALAVARVAHALEAGGGKASLPGLYADLTQKVDLLYRPRGKDAPGVYLQIKSDTERETTSMHIIDVDLDASVSQRDPFILDLIEGLRQFRDQHQEEAWIAAFLVVGQAKFSRTFEVRDCPGIREVILPELAKRAA